MRLWLGLGPMAPTVGIWRDITLLAVDAARLEGVLIEQHHAGDAVALDVQATVGRLADEQLTCKVAVHLQGDLVAEAQGDASSGVKLDIPEPQLWWPNGMGAQPLYDVSVCLLGADGRELDQHQERIGLRTVTVRRDKDEFGESFCFHVNGRDIFAKGANWIPCDVFIPRIADATYEHLIQSSADAGMNMIRVWGGGFYEQDIFYDLCDEKGILLWQDFMFACSTYPSFDQSFMDNIRQEAIDNVRRLRNHPVLRCGAVTMK